MIPALCLSALTVVAEMLMLGWVSTVGLYTAMQNFNTVEADAMGCITGDKDLPAN